MEYYSTNGDSKQVSLSEAVIKGLAPDKGLYIPETIVSLPQDFFDNIDKMSFRQIACVVAEGFFGEDIPKEDLDKIVCETLSFETPLVNVDKDIYALELFHGPTAAFKDVGARFMARMLSYFIASSGEKRHVTVLVATSGDTGSAVANGFLGVDGIDVVVLYPRGKVSPIQEIQFTTLGNNITALEIDGTFDDCQRLVKSAFMDEELNKKFKLTSANSINIARFLPQAFYYFNAYAQLKAQGRERDMVVAVPSGNFGNITAGLYGKRMGLPIKRFIVANNRNDIFLQYLNTGKYRPKASIQTIANAMDVGDPSNFARVLALYGGDVSKIREDITAYSYQDEQIANTIREVYKRADYLLDPHGACGYMALKEGLIEGETGVFLETAHPAKFLDTVEPIINKVVEIPQTLRTFLSGQKQTIELSSDFDDFKRFLTAELGKYNY